MPTSSLASFEIAVLGGTPGGIATAVRAAREGHDVALLTYNESLGGMMAGGLSYTDTLTKKPRAPVLEEFTAAVRDHYRERYGEDSNAYDRCEDGYIFEPHVAERIFEELVDEPSLTVHRGVFPQSAERDERKVTSLVVETATGRRRVNADLFVDATYEGDLIETAGVSYRIGREPRTAYDEQFAGRLFTGVRGDRYYPRAAVGAGDHTAPPDRRGPLDVPPEKRQGDLDLTPHPSGLTEIYPGSTGRGDNAIQAYNYRLCLSRDPDNRRYPEKPAGYDRSEYLEKLSEIEERGLRSYLLLRYLPNEKADMNAADLPGENHEYPEADRNRRREIAARHRSHALGLLYFLQNDDAVPDAIQSAAREWGLAEDEFTENDHFPWQLYIRESRRLDGRYTFSENDARLADGIDRTPIHDDAIATAEYPLDSHACTTEKQLGSQPDGFFYASQVTRPSQVPYRALLPTDVDNVLVPVPLSATHVAYGTIRLEPTWLHIGEAAGVALSIARENGNNCATIETDELQHRLLRTGIQLSFFNDCEITDGPYAEAVQYLGTKGFFSSYDAAPEDSLTESVASFWAEKAPQLKTNDHDPTECAQTLPRKGSDPVTTHEFCELLAEQPALARQTPAELDGTGADDYLTRAEACYLVYRSV